MDVPTTSDKTLSYGSCEQLTSKPSQKLVQYCKIQDAFEIEPAFMNTERLLAHPFKIRQISFSECLKCRNFSCSLSNWAGMLIKLVLDCEDYEEPSGLVSSCFIFKVNGIRNVTAPATTTTTTTTTTTKKNTTVISMKKEEEKINTSTIMIIVILVCLCLVVLVVLSIVLLRYRKKKLIRRKSQCAHYLTKASSGEENVYAEMGNPAYEDTDVTYESGTILRYARPDNNRLSDQDPPESKMEENDYYKTADINGNDKELANTLYGMESNHEREHIYAESTDTQNIIPEAQPEYAYTSNVFDDTVKDVSYQYAEVKTKKKDKQNNLRPENMFAKKISGYDEVGSVMDPK
ncbi:uncharacterized protein LOC130626203 isoform X2 [Hydractinia symbiolongicarpus]|nr:uncharacterized protein LOC130626203 isoform X2 [Hydractinia symbiolongicarpus]